MSAIVVNVVPGDESQAWSAASCPVCTDTTPAGATCPGCQPEPSVRRCIVCARRGPVIGGGPEPLPPPGPPPVMP